jgi:hypothetical protein
MANIKGKFPYLAEQRKKTEEQRKKIGDQRKIRGIAARVDALAAVLSLRTKRSNLVGGRL